MCNNRGVLLLSIILTISWFSRCAESFEINYCAENTLNTTGYHMQFTKETTYEEFALAGKFKALHCCAKGYRSIEWYKDGKIYPWPLGPSHLILYPESANQTIYTQSVTEDDAGNYTCVLRNDSTIRSHTIHLTVFDKIPTDPKITFVSQNQEIQVGDSVRLFCEAFGGRVDLPDAYNIAEWQKTLANGTLIPIPDHLEQIGVNREDGQTFGTYLIFSEVKKEDYGTYTCIISKPGNTIWRHVSVAQKVPVEKYIDPNPFPVKLMIFWMTGLLIVIVALLILYRQFGLKLQVRLKDTLGSVEVDDGKTHDVLVLYSAKDSEIALGVLLSILENRYQYKCASRELSGNISHWYTELKMQAQKCRRIVAVISPSTLADSWDASNIQQALEQLMSLGPKITCVSLKELPVDQNQPKNAQGKTLASVQRSISVILWQREQSADDQFWLKLLLRLPARRRNGAVEHDNTPQVNNSEIPTAPQRFSRLNSRDSQDSFSLELV